jgi:hypothetical protein
MTEKSRSWWNFSLRTLFIGVTVLCGYLAYQMSVIRARDRVRQELKQIPSVQVLTVAEFRNYGVLGSQEFATIPWSRRLLGDEPIQRITYYGFALNGQPGLREKVERTFPEAELQEILPEPCHPGCFPHNTLVSTPRGSVRIDAIACGDEVYAISGAGQRISLPVVSIFRTRNRLWVVETSGGRLVTTETQPLMATTGSAVEAGKLRPGDVILRWQEATTPTGTLEPVEVISVRSTPRVAPVINLVLGNRESFVANGFLARSKPPAAATSPPSSPPHTHIHNP